MSVSYVLRVHVREAEPYTGLQDEQEVREAVHQEVENTISDLGSDILEEGTDEECEQLAEQLTEKVMADLWRFTRDDETSHRLPGGRNSRQSGVLLTLANEED